MDGMELDTALGSSLDGGALEENDVAELLRLLLKIAGEVTAHLAQDAPSEEVLVSLSQRYARIVQTVHNTLLRRLKACQGSGHYQKSCYEREAKLRAAGMSTQLLSDHLAETLELCRQYSEKHSLSFDSASTSL
mmetsp:Transcript_22994/g.64605  ORF Transcript_22994/g.64605 Transcript_22994/m.64605 type:complete len:134 (-) Transcript_22994:174-575(-)|eukprot:CAMPEP_0119119662 /NCGR_PEP_ID=MMETSP1310-20130426/1055_1 /TAXON_ID=464262 /ORGANISM="Genus nov. species nov., Strain RCC2339" /LENGTH=133 /DNA_ID=CAMNT_0007109107 /DNA_START=99 /DNA_END=500 /DNA_ORIENTATION=-